MIARSYLLIELPGFASLASLGQLKVRPTPDALLDPTSGLLDRTSRSRRVPLHRSEPIAIFHDE